MADLIKARPHLLHLESKNRRYPQEYIEKKKYKYSYIYY